MLPVSRDPMVRVVTHQLAPKRALLLQNRRIPIPPTPLANTTQCTTEARTGRPASYDQNSWTGLPPIVSEAQKLKASPSRLSR